MTIPPTMQAAVFHGPGDLRVEPRDVPRVVPGSVLVAVRACAVCGSDIRIAREGNPRIVPPRILGHEIAGDVVAVGEGVRHFRVGERVAIGADVPCGTFAHCTGGRANCCDVNHAVGYQFDGGFADYILLDPLVVRGGPVHTFSPDVGYAEAALAEPLGCCLNGYERSLMERGKSVAIFGAGPIGLMLLMLARQQYGATRVIVIEPSPLRRDAAARFGATETIDPGAQDPVAAVADLTNGAGVDRVFTACAVVATHEPAVAMIAKRGVVNFFGGVSKTAPPISVLSNAIHYKEAYITGAHGSTPEQHERALGMIAKGEVNVASLITDRVPLSRIAEGMDAARNGRAIKVVVEMAHG